MPSQTKRMHQEPPSAVDTPIRILHLSDLHLCPERRWDADPVLTQLAKTIAEEVSQRGAPDVVAITGDIANEGRPGDYAEAHRWLDKQLRPALHGHLPDRNILVVPGNHDVFRPAVKRAAYACQRDLLASEDQDAIAEILGDPEEREALLRRHDAYLKFANDLRDEAGRLDVPWWSRVVELRGCRIHFAGLCSSWMSCSDQDHGRLLVGRWQVNELLKNAADADWSVALVHHPWSYLPDFDGGEIEKTIRRDCDLVLRGHLHDQQTRVIRSPGDIYLELAAGSTYFKSNHPNGFQMVDLTPDRKEVRVRYWLWRDGRWLLDRTAYPDMPEGEATFDLDARPQQGGKTAPKAAADPAKYLRSLRERTAYIDIRGLQVGTDKDHRFPLDQLYIRLTITHAAGLDLAEYQTQSSTQRHPESRAEAVEHAARESRIELDEVLNVPRLVIVGDSGAGKSTFLHRVAFLLSSAQLGDLADAPHDHLRLAGNPFPILVRLAELAQYIEAAFGRGDGPALADAPAWLPHFLAAACKADELELDETFFRDQLTCGEALVLLDGLDEVPTARQRRQLASLVQKASGEAYENCRFVLTSRPGAYEGEVVLPTFSKVSIDLLEDDAIATFLKHWYSALFPESPARAERNCRDLHGALQHSATLRQMARNPIMLTALAVHHWNDKRLPEQRAELCESIIRYLARAREHRPGRPPPERCVAIYQELALAMQDHADGPVKQVPRFWAAEQIAGEFHDGNNGKERVQAAEVFLEQEALCSGIVVLHGHNVRFLHGTLQEYLAARAFAACPSDEQSQRLFRWSDKLHQPAWREVVLLLSGVFYRQGPRRVDAMFSAILEQLGTQASLTEKARCFGLLVAVVQDLTAFGYEPRDPRFRELASDVLAVFDSSRSDSVRIKDAIKAAEALGVAGDPRFAMGSRGNNWVGIETGTFFMGAQAHDASKANFDQEALNAETPVHEVRLNKYCIGRYPVTVLEYREFVENGGYSDEAHWQAGGFGRWRQPHNWEKQLTHLNRPVTEVSWYEAAAYAAWLGSRLRNSCQLPSEAAWERAARGTKMCRYPWGDEAPAEDTANYGRIVEAPTPVGVYPRAASPDGVMDIAGNVWEWCADVWHDDYDGAPCDGSAWTKGGDKSARVTRGGSWYDDPAYCRAAYRGRGAADERDSDIGFRVATAT